MEDRISELEDSNVKLIKVENKMETSSKVSEETKLVFRRKGVRIESSSKKY